MRGRFLLPVVAALSLGLASAGAAEMPSSSSFDDSDAKTAVASILGVGVALVVGMTIFTLGRRSADAISDDGYAEYLEREERFND